MERNADGVDLVITAGQPAHVFYPEVNITVKDSGIKYRGIINNNNLEDSCKIYESLLNHIAANRKKMVLPRFSKKGYHIIDLYISHTNEHNVVYNFVVHCYLNDVKSNCEIGLLHIKTVVEKHRIDIELTHLKDSYNSLLSRIRTLEAQVFEK